MVNGNPNKSNDGGTRPALQLPRYHAATVPVPVPARGGDGYSEDTREIVVQLRDHLPNYREYTNLRNTNMPGLPCKRSVQRWKKRIREKGHNVRMRHTGNRRSNAIVGFPLLLLALYRRAYPKATRAQCIAYLYRAYGSTLPIVRVFNVKNITDAENKLGLNRKKRSTTAHQAYTIVNITRRSRFWNLSYPHGITDIPSDRMIDVDECGIKFEDADRRYGKCVIARRVRERGNYGHGVNHTLKLAISGENTPIARRWVQLDTNGTNVFNFYEFILHILTDLGQAVPGFEFCFTFDNLLAHHNDAVLALILGWGHRYVFRAPYYPVDGPIEYVFNTIENALGLRMYEINNIRILYNEIYSIIRSIPNFVNYFRNCGFN